MYVRATVVLGLLMGGSGCAKMASGSSAPSMEYAAYDDYDDYGGSYDEAEADYAAEPQSVMREESAVSDRRSSRRAKRADKAGNFASGGSAPGDAAAPPEPTPATGEGTSKPEPAVAEDEDVPDHGRHIIYTATLQVAVFNLEDAMLRAESLPGKYGGYVQNMSTNYFVMRIPAVKLRQAMDEMAGLGTVQNRTLDAQDVTEEFLDIETRIEVLQATQKQMMELLTKARTVEEALKVRQALDQITMELEVLKGRMRRLSSLISFSTLTLNLVERGPHNATPSSNDPFPWVDRLGVEATEWK